MTGSAPRPFDGIRILDLTHVLAGPFCTYQLAVLGAETIKIEEPGRATSPARRAADKALNRQLMGTGYLTQGANKRCLTLDLKDPRGQDILKRLVARADVLVENFRAGAMAALGLGYEDLRAINPRLVYCSMTGFGQDGPKAQDNAYDCVIQAISGLMSTTGWPSMPPLKTGAPVIDYASGLSAAFAISCALFQRERTGCGQRVDCAMLDTALMLMSSHLTAYLWTGVAPSPAVTTWSTRRQRLRDQGRHPDAGLVPGRSAPASLDGAGTAGHRRAMAGAGSGRASGAHGCRAPGGHAHADRRGVGEFLASIHVPAARVRNLAETLALEQLERRRLLHRFERVPEDRPAGHCAGRGLPVPRRRAAGRHAAAAPRRRHECDSRRTGPDGAPRSVRYGRPVSSDTGDRCGEEDRLAGGDEWRSRSSP